MTSFGWHQIRAWAGTQHAGFEQLCCQLFALEQPEAGATFTRNGRPDGGVECYWTTGAGDIHALQAKFFPSDLGQSQWAQVEESIKTALGCYPRLKHFRLCLPKDLPDERRDRVHSARFKWNAIIEKWTATARRQGRAVTFDLWDDHALGLRLNRDEHAGRVRFWFDQDRFDRAWFRRTYDRLRDAIGDRYRPDLDVDVPVRLILEGLGRTASFEQRLSELAAEVKRKIRDCRLTTSREHAPSEADATQAAIQQLQVAVTPLTLSRFHEGSLAAAATVITGAEVAVTALVRSLYSIRDTLPTKHDSPSSSPRDRVAGELHTLDKLAGALQDLREFLSSEAALLIANPFLLLTGEAGSGKTHLIADVTRARLDLGLPTVMVLGQQVRSADDLWAQILKALDLADLRANEFLGVLQAGAEAVGRRALILIDGINEGSRTTWHDLLPVLVADVGRYSMVGLAVSVRSTFTEATVPASVRTTAVQVEHPGFRGVEQVAASRYFAEFGIREPGTPLLLPEFSNPLFLSLLCVAVHGRGEREIPQGIEGFTTLLGFFLENAEIQVARRADGSPSHRRVGRAVRSLASAMVSAGTDWVSLEEAERVCKSIGPAAASTRPLLQELLSEGILGEVANVTEDGFDVPAIRFLFERIGDHLRAMHLCREMDSPTAWRDAFAPGGRMAFLTDSTWAMYQHGGLVEALSLQCAERCGAELIDLIPEEARRRAARDAFLHSVVWRKSATCSSRTAELLLVALNDGDDEGFNTILVLAPRPDHPLNAQWLHGRLCSVPMPQRDLVWSNRLFSSVKYEDSTGTLANRLVEWATRTSPETPVTDEAAYCCALTLTWFLATSHRTLRDRSTKALVALLTRRPRSLCRLLRTFEEIDDPYIAERLYAVAYGCALRAGGSDIVAELASTVWDLAFAHGAPPPHLLLRDYARGVIERAVSLGVVPDGVDLSQVRPPYSSEWNDDFPTFSELSPRFAPAGYPRSIVWHSVAGGGDFDRYIVGTNSWHFKWVRVGLGQRTPTSRQLVNAFLASLTEAQTSAFYRWAALRLRSPPLAKLLDPSLGADIQRVNDLGHMGWAMGSDDGGARARVEAAERAEQDAIAALLDREHRIAFEETVVRHVQRSAREDVGSFSPRTVHRWVLNRILELGWDTAAMEQFDRTHARETGRSAGKPERLGKKYQWIAWHQFMAHVADRFQFRPGHDRHLQEYQGPWQVSARDIDPSSLVRATPADGKATCWWSPLECDFARGEASDEGWTNDLRSLPEMPRLLEVVDGAGVRWLVLSASREWEEPVPPGDEHAGVPQRDRWREVSTFIVKRARRAAVLKWLRGHPEQFGDLPRNSYQGDRLFLREAGWSPAWADIADDRQGFPGWSRRSGHGAPDLPASLLATSFEYFSELSSSDCSLDDSLRITLPTPWLADQLQLRPTLREGEYVDTGGQVVMFDPSVRERGPSCLLLRATALAGLRAAGYDIVWVVRGELRAGTWSDIADYTHAGARDFSGAWSRGEKAWTGWLDVLPEEERHVGPGPFADPARVGARVGAARIRAERTGRQRAAFLTRR